MQFLDKEALQQYLEEYARPLGFRITQTSHNDAKLGLVKGYMHCWCYLAARVKPDGRDARVYHTDLGKVNCSCRWRVAYRKSANDVMLSITKVEDEHTGHILRAQPRPTVVDKARHLRLQEDVPQAIVDKMRELLSYSQPGRAWTQDHVSGCFNVTFDDHVFRNLFRSLISQVSYQPNEQDWRDAVKWGRCLGQDALVSVDMDQSTCQGRRLLFMSPAMTYNFHRNNEVIVMDTTHGTNRYRFYLLLLVGMSHFGHSTIMAAALLRNQSQDDFVWVLSQIKAFVGSAVWDRIKTISTDGDVAMKLAIEAILPFICVASGMSSVTSLINAAPGWGKGLRMQCCMISPLWLTRSSSHHRSRRLSRLYRICTASIRTRAVALISTAASCPMCQCSPHTRSSVRLPSGCNPRSGQSRFTR
jgi:hypothetical protein